MRGTCKTSEPVWIPSDVDLARVMESFRDECGRLAEELESGGSISAWRKRFEQLLWDGHRDAYGLGTRRASGKAPLAGEADQVAKKVLESEQRYLDGFEAALHEDQVLNPLQRMSMYAGRMRGTAYGGWFDGSSDDETFRWHLGIADHCEDCRKLDGESPYSKETLPTVPGANETDCGFNCKCWLSRESDGQTGFGHIRVWNGDGSYVTLHSPSGRDYQPSRGSRYLVGFRDRSPGETIREIHNRDLEVLAVYDGDELVFDPVEGLPNKVTFTEKEAALAKGKRLIHNHPDDLPFSGADTLVLYDLKARIDAVTPSGTVFSMFPADLTEDEATNLALEIQATERMLYDENARLRKLKQKALEGIAAQNYVWKLQKEIFARYRVEVARGSIWDE